MQGSNRIWSVVVSKDGRWTVSGEKGGKVVIWNAATHEKVLEFREHEPNVRAVDISSDSTKLAVAGGGIIKIFSITSGTRLLPPLPHNWAISLKFSPDGSRFATTSPDSDFRIYSTYNGDILFDSGPTRSIDDQVGTPLAWSSDGQQLFVATKGKITSFNVSHLSYSEWSIHETQSLASIASSGRFIACSAGTSVSLWDCVSHKQIGTIMTHNANLNCIALSPTGGYLACGLKGGKITIHSLREVLPPEYFYRRLPLVQVRDEALESWIQDDPTNTELLLSAEITSASSPSHYVLANRALIRARLKHWTLAAEDVKESLRVQPSPIGYIAMAIVLLGQGDRDGALCTFDRAFHDCELHDVRLLLLLKSFLVFESGNQEEAIERVEYLTTRANKDDDEATYLYSQARTSHNVLGAMYMKQGNYARVIQLSERAKSLAPKQEQSLPLKTISLIFGWSFSGLDVIAQQCLSETLYAEGRTREAVEILLNIIKTSDKEILGRKETVDWIADFTKKCATTLEHVGDEAFRSVKHDDTITQYTTALSLCRLFIMQSRARAEKGLWEHALQDANEAVKAGPSYPWGHEAKYVALHGAKRYDAAIDAFKSMLHVIEESHNPAIKQLRKNYISPSETIKAIDPIVRGTLESCPLVVVDVTTGYLCDSTARTRVFKDSSTFKGLVSSMTRELDNERIRQVVASFFGYVMLSHVWQGNEPLFQDVNAVKSVWNLPGTPQNEKLRNFCNETRRLGHNWAWSDTCCIDKATSSVLNQSVTSMYRWYADSAATLVYLADVAHPSKPGDLTRSHWMARAWTLQELLVPQVVLFYDSEWKPYLGNTSPNHKESPEIMQELADAIKIPHGNIVTFLPDDLGVREKLRLASTRNATVKEDVAYSLIGIFKSDIRPQYVEGADALGHLLEEIVARSGEVTVLAWSGESSSYNSCLPASLSVYNQIPYNPPSLEGEEMETCITELRGKLAQQDALSIYNRISFLPAARFATRRLHLPCIVFSVRRLVMHDLHRGNEKLYRAKVSGLGKVEFTTADELPLDKPQKLVFVHPWIRYIRGPSDGVAWGDDLESDTDSDSDLDLDSSGEVGWDEVAPPSPSRAGSTPQIDDYTRALQTIARLRQPFNALLLIQLPNGEYKRVAAENEIVVSGLGTDITSKNIWAKVLEVL
ncbi:hypothetical protein EDC04DRAFT_3144985 [Pisolithus marmoratus]|nr:hypothetical protein EDC04DRAFT_3144985 [Pisolithus marmoratus]